MSGLFSNLLRKNSMDGKSDLNQQKRSKPQHLQQVPASIEASYASKMADQQARIKSEREGEG